MTSEDGRWDPATVLGLRSSDRVLVIGNPVFLPWLPPLFEQNASNLVSVRKANQIDVLLRSGRCFDKVILTRETAYNHDHALYAAAFHAQLVVFPRSEGDAFHLEQSVEFYYPDAQFWKFDSTFGPVAMAEVAGASWRVMMA